LPGAGHDNEGVHAIESTAVLDREQLREVTMDDGDLMRQILDALIEDTSSQIAFLAAAVENRDAAGAGRLAHYSKGACANIGAQRAASLFWQIEDDARQGRFDACAKAVESIGHELDLLRGAAQTF
jgi:HPt (histidine-containing phosphotransfer) domain-containing protein